MPHTSFMRVLGLASAPVAMLFSSTVFAANPGDPGTGIFATAHDFASASGNQILSVYPNATSPPLTGLNGSVVGICTFCHTPHKAIATLLLWNHTLSSNTFSWDVPTTTAGTTFPKISGSSYLGPTAKCLSCHDGSVAVGDVAWYQETSRTGANALTTWKMGQTSGDGMATAQFVIGGGGNMAGNHPVAMPYPYNQGKNNTYNGVKSGPALVATEFQADPTTLSPAHIRLFNDDGAGHITAGPVNGQSGIECSSCHDPHNKATLDGWLLRGYSTGATQADGYICLQCHIK